MARVVSRCLPQLVQCCGRHGAPVECCFRQNFKLKQLLWCKLPGKAGKLPREFACQVAPG